ncbi:MAG: cell division protein FtsQ/DivIB [Azoarcus sp.]|nr:cell division protein FtsQ/DivIB [Azoarcus sp.]
MAEPRKRPPAAARPERRTGLWHRPQLLDLVSDVLLLFAAVGLGWALVSWVLSRPLFPLRALVLDEPPAQVTQAQLEYVARTAIHGNFFTARLDDVRAAFEKLPWVRRAEVRRVWPDVLELNIEEHEAVAYWENTGSGDNDVRLINRHGEVFVASSDADMPAFSGPQGSGAAMLARHAAYLEMLRPLRSKLVGMDLSARGAWQLRFDNGMTIVLGREREHRPLDARLARFVSAWPKLREELGMRIARVDLRYPDGFALTPMDDHGADASAAIRGGITHETTAPRPAAGIDRK